MRPVDPVKLSVLWDSLISIAEEMTRVVERTAYSEIIRDGHDYSTALFDANGDLVSQGVNTPGHLGSMPFLVKSLLTGDHPPGAWRDGDVVVTNDPHLGAGHLPDLSLITPVFHQGGLVGFAAITIHLIDVGGMYRGSVSPNPVEIYQEGLQVPVVKLVSAGALNEDILKFIQVNSREPHLVTGDIQACLAALEQARRRFLALLDTYGRDIVEGCVREIFCRSEERTRAAIRAIPAGRRFAFADTVDDYGDGTPPIRVQVAIWREGDDLYVDFAGTDPEVPKAINSTLTYTRAYAMVPVKAVLCPHVPQNAGAIRPLHVSAPPGSFLNCSRTAATGARVMSANIVFDTVVGALYQIAPDKVMAGSAGSQECINFSGYNPLTARQFTTVEVLYGGTGGRHGKDGVNAVSMPNNLKNIPVEVLELKAPFVVERYELLPGSGGAGTWRGGCGIRRDYRLLADCTLVYKADSQKFAPYGLGGGKPGKTGACILWRAGTETRLPSKSVYHLLKGDLVSFRSPAGGGFGPPAQRRRELIQADLRAGYITEADLHEYAEAVAAGEES